MIGLENSSLILLREFAVEYCVAELQDMGIPDPTWVGLDPNVLWKAIHRRLKHPIAGPLNISGQRRQDLFTAVGRLLNFRHTNVHVLIGKLLQGQLIGQVLSDLTLVNCQLLSYGDPEERQLVFDRIASIAHEYRPF